VHFVVRYINKERKNGDCLAAARVKADYARAVTEYNNAIKQPILKPATTHDLP